MEYASARSPWLGHCHKIVAKDFRFSPGACPLRRGGQGLETLQERAQPGVECCLRGFHAGYFESCAEHRVKVIEPHAGDRVDVLKIPFPLFDACRVTSENPVAAQGFGARRERGALRDR